MDTGFESIDDAAELRKIRRQALRVHVKSFISAVALTGIFLVM